MTFTEVVLTVMVPDVSVEIVGLGLVKVLTTEFVSPVGIGSTVFVLVLELTDVANGFEVGVDVLITILGFKMGVAEDITVGVEVLSTATGTGDETLLLFLLPY